MENKTGKGIVDEDDQELLNLMKDENYVYDDDEIKMELEGKSSGEESVFKNINIETENKKKDENPILFKKKRGRGGGKGRKKIPIEYITDTKKRKACFKKRSKGLVKKAIELEILTGCEMFLYLKDDDGKSRYVHKTKNLDFQKVKNLEGVENGFSEEPESNISSSKINNQEYSNQMYIPRTQYYSIPSIINRYPFRYPNVICNRPRVTYFQPPSGPVFGIMGHVSNMNINNTSYARNLDQNPNYLVNANSHSSHSSENKE